MLVQTCSFVNFVHSEDECHLIWNDNGMQHVKCVYQYITIRYRHSNRFVYKKVIYRMKLIIRSNSEWWDSILFK